MEDTNFPVAAGGNHQPRTGSSTDFITYDDLPLHQIPEGYTMDDFLWDESGAGHTPLDPLSSGENSNQSAAAGQGQGQGQQVPQQLVGLAAMLDGHMDLPWGWPAEFNPNLSQVQVQVHPHSVGDPTSSFTGVGAGAVEMMQSTSTQLGFHIDMREVNATHNHSAAAAAAAVEDVRLPPVANAGLARPLPDPYSTGATRCCASTAAARGMGMGSTSPLDLGFNGGAGLPQSGGGDGGKAPARGSYKRKKLLHGSSSSQKSTSDLEFENLMDIADIFSRANRTYTNSPTGDMDIIHSLDSRKSSMADGEQVELSLGEEDQRAPSAARDYFTTVKMRPDQKTHLGYWKENKIVFVSHNDYMREAYGMKRTLEFHKSDGTQTNWRMDEYISLGRWGADLYMKGLRYRKVYMDDAEAPGDPKTDPASPDVKIPTRIATANKHRMRGPDNMVINGESSAWQHFFKIYDRHPEMAGSQVVYALCRHCKVVLKAGPAIGTRTLLNHCDQACPVKNKNQQPRSSR